MSAHSKDERDQAMAIAGRLMASGTPTEAARRVSPQGVLLLARALLSTSAAERRMREALEEILARDSHGFGVPLGTRLRNMCEAALSPKGEG